MSKVIENSSADVAVQGFDPATMAIGTEQEGR